jgi:hypothetical protein
VDEEMMPEQEMPVEMEQPGMAPEGGGDQFAPNASESVRAAVTQLRDAMDDEEFDPVIESMVTAAAPGQLSKAIASVLALLFTGVGESLGVEGAEVVDVMEHIAADLVEFAQQAGNEEAQDDAIAEQVMRDAVEMIQSSGIVDGAGEDMEEPGEMEEEGEEMEMAELPQQQPRGFARRIPGV